MSSQISYFSSKLCCRMSAKWLYGKQYILHCCSASQYYHTTFHSVNTEQYGTSCCLTLTAGGALCVSLIWRRPALKIVVLMLQYQTIDRNIFFSFCYWYMRSPSRVFGWIVRFRRTTYTKHIVLRVQFSLSVSSWIADSVRANVLFEKPYKNIKFLLWKF